MQWIKMYTAKCLRGSLHFDLPYTRRAIWYELLLMAGDGDNEGVIEYPHSFLASQLGCPVKALAEVLEVLEKTDRITISDNQIIIRNWNKYQGVKQRDRKKHLAELTLATPLEHSDFDQFVDEMRAEYPLLDIDSELKGFDLFNKESKRKLQRPKSAFRNWLERAGKYPTAQKKIGKTNSSHSPDGMQGIKVI